MISANNYNFDLRNVSGAVGDLVHGYDVVVSALPNVADKVVEMHVKTENLAKELEGRMRNLVDGYEYLDSISAQIPESLREIAATHRKALDDASEILTRKDKLNSKDSAGELERLKAELRSITHERIVVDVFSKQNSVRHKQNQPATGRSERLGRSTGAVGISMNGSGAMPPNSATNRVATNVTGTGAPTGLYQPIPLPTYTPGAGALLADGLPLNSDGQASNPGGNRASTAVASARSSNGVRARAVGDGFMVPSMRQGYLPEELRDLKTTPVAAAGEARLIKRKNS
jgi:hypothetical protein